MRRNYLLALLTGLGLAPVPALAAWHSGGGELVRDETNPWFIQNTEVVKACISVDPEHFHLRANDSLQATIEKALNYWRGEFAKQSDSLMDVVNFPKLATQTVEFGPCTESTDLRFQFGVLTPEQEAGLKSRGADLRRFVSLAMRTNYDQSALKARGFIYVAADSGPLRPDFADMLEQPWAENGVLFRVLAHELGHTYGLSHTSSGGGGIFIRDLMSAQWPETMVDKKTYAQVTADSLPIMPFFSHLDHGAVSGTCGPTHNGVDEGFPKAAVDFLGVPMTERCILVQQRDAEHVDISVNWTIPQLIGSVTLDKQQLELDDYQPIRMWLPPGQSFVKLPSWYDHVDFAIGGARRTWLQTGVYRDTKGGHEHKVVFTAAPGNQFTLAGLLNDGLLLDITEPWNPLRSQYAP